jgi:oligoribonuclease NrnB/cAMP/cGMP phosphodiesterase (DHH superfamily)
MNDGLSSSSSSSSSSSTVLPTDPTEYLNPSSVNLVLYHDKCPDGFGAAFIAWKKLGNRAEYIGCDHTYSNIPSVQGKRVVILDFSFKSDVTLEMIHGSERAERLLVIDHHHTSEIELKQVPEQNKIFNMKHSGCILAWDFFFGKTLQMAPPFLYHIEDRDLWNWKLKNSQEICAALDTYPQTFEQWDTFTIPDALTRLKFQGESVVRYRQSLVDMIVAKSTEITFEGYRCRVVNANGGTIISNVANQLLENYPKTSVAMTWYEDYPSRQLKVSLRSRPGIDCSAIATKYGGGGHKQASGFFIDFDKKEEFKCLFYSMKN